MLGVAHGFRLAPALVFVACSQSALAVGQDDWSYEFTPYLLAASLDGTAGVAGHEFDVDASFSDIWENLEMGFMGLFTARRGPWSFGLEAVYMNLEDSESRSVTGPGGLVSIGGKLDVAAKMTILQGSVAYRVLDEATKVDLVGALRYTRLDLDASVEIAFAPPVFGGATSARGHQDWTDFVVGARVEYPVGEDVALMGYADIGAGGSDLTYQLLGGVNWEFSDGFTAKVGYRHLAWDYRSGGNTWDIAAAGPYLGVGIRF